MNLLSVLTTLSVLIVTLLDGNGQPVPNRQARLELYRYLTTPDGAAAQVWFTGECVTGEDGVCAIQIEHPQDETLRGTLFVGEYRRDIFLPPGGGEFQLVVNLDDRPGESIPYEGQEGAALSIRRQMSGWTWLILALGLLLIAALTLYFYRRERP